MSNFQVIGRNGKPIKTKITLHPGEVLFDELEAREISQKDFAKTLSMQPTHLSALIKGKRHVSAKLALKLEEVLDIDAEFWMRVQVAFDLDTARKELAEENT